MKNTLGIAVGTAAVAYVLWSAGHDLLGLLALAIAVAVPAFWYLLDMLERCRRQLVDAVCGKPEPQPQEPPRMKTRADREAARGSVNDKLRKFPDLDGE